jgi:hypothetical protein
MQTITRIISPILLLLTFLKVNAVAQTTAFETAFEQDNNYSATYQEVIAYYEQLSAAYPQISFTAHGSTDSGFPLHTVVLSKDADFSPESIRAKGKLILFVNNGIHAGEPCGVDATMMLLRDYVQKRSLQEFLEKVVIVAIPFYNIGGGLNRGSFSRANQLGPEAHGFRGNAKNLDLNRDFIKCDSKNAQTFNQVFNYWQPDIFIDNHTSNGADYQYTLTLIATQHNKLNSELAHYLNNDLLPNLYKNMKARNWEMTPYVYARSTPDEGIAAFLDLPRYSSGYAALHNTISFMPETHMLKPFKDRVRSVYHFMDVMIQEMHYNSKRILETRKRAKELSKTQNSFDLSWELDFAQSDTILFKGYEAMYKPSEISGKDRLYYDRNAPYEKEIPYYRYYKTTKSVKKPLAYVIPQAYQDVIERLRWNGVAMRELSADAELELDFYYIKDYKTSQSAYEGHYLHSAVEVEQKTLKRQFYKGDVVIFTNQTANRYIIETLEPQASDSYFAWNFFDGILMQKEYFSSYVFEDLALQILKDNPELKAELETEKAKNEELANSARAQLDFIYKRSPHYELTHNLYPVGRLTKNADLPLK